MTVAVDGPHCFLRRACLGFERPAIGLLQLDDGHAALALAVTAQTEALDHSVSPQMLMDSSAQCAGTIAVDEIYHSLAVQNRTVDEGIHLRQRLVYGKTQQVAFHLCRTLYALYPAVGPVGVAGQAGVTLLCLGLRLRLLDQLFRLLEAFERHFRLDDAGPYENIAVFIRQREHGSQLVQLCDADLLPYLDFLQRNELLDRVVYHFSPHKELFGLFLGDLTGALGLLLGAHPLVFLDLAQLIRQSVSLALDLLRQCASLGAGSFQLILALLDKLIALLTGCIQLVGSLVFQAFHLVLTGFELELQIIQLAQNSVQTLVFCG